MLQYRHALKYFTHCVTLDSNRIDLLNGTARIAAALGKNKLAESYYQRTLDRDSTNFNANYQLARLFGQKGENEKSAMILNGLIKDDSTNIMLLRALGDCYKRDSKPFMATMAYLKAFKYNPENLSLANTLINMMLPLEQILEESPLDICDTALYYHPDNPIILQQKGTILFSHRKYQQADEIFTHLTSSLGDSSALTLKYGGCSKFYTKQYMDANTLLEKAYDRVQDDIDLCLIFGASLGRTIDRTRAFELFDEAEELMQPKPAHINLLLQFRAETYPKNNQPEKAIPLYYTLWQNDKKLSRLLPLWHHYYTRKKVEGEQQQRKLYIDYLLAKEQIRITHETSKTNKDQEPSWGMNKTLDLVLKTLESEKEEMFFKGKKESIMITPDNKKVVITEEQLKKVIKQLEKKPPPPPLFKETQLK